MSRIQILYPMASMALLTFTVGVVMLRLRFRAVARGQINPRHFLLNRGGRVPEYLARVEQNYLNLFELPVLFYALVLALYATASVTPLQLGLAWGFVLTRVMHSLIHATVNRLRWRMWVFSAGALLLMAAWALFVLHLGSTGAPPAGRQDGSAPGTKQDRGLALFPGARGAPASRRQAARMPALVVGRDQLPATVMRSISQEPVSMLPGMSLSLPTASRSLNIWRRLPATVISDTG